MLAAAALGKRLDVPPATEYRAGIGQRVDLVHAMRDEQNCGALVTQRAQQCIHRLHVTRGQRRRGLVHDQHPRRSTQRLGEFHQLPARQGQVAHRHPRVDVRTADPRQQRFCSSTLRPMVDEAADARWTGDRDVIRDTQVRQQRQFLEHADEAVPHRIQRIGEMHRLAVHLHVPAVRSHRAGDDLDQRALAGTVFAQHGVD